MMSTVITRKYDPPAIDRGEILRYMGCRRQTPEIEALIDSCLDEANGRLSCKVCYGVFDTDLFCAGKEAAPMGSLDLKKNLTGCSRSILFAATIGIRPGPSDFQIQQTVSRQGSVFSGHRRRTHRISVQRFQ